MKKENYVDHMCVHVLYSVASVMSDSSQPRIVAHQAPLSLEFSRQEYSSGLPHPPPGDLPNPGTKPVSPASLALQADSFYTEPPGKSSMDHPYSQILQRTFGKKKCMWGI